MLSPVKLRWLRQRWPASLAVVACVLLALGLSLRPASSSPAPVAAAPALLGAISIQVVALSGSCEVGATDTCSRPVELDADAGTPGDALGGARVRVFQILGQQALPWAEVVSDGRGRARVPAASGVYWLLVDAPGRARRSERLTFAGQLARASIALPLAEPLSVSVQDSAGQPIAGATVLVSGDDELPHAALTSAAGLARLEHVGHRVESVRVSAPGHDSALINPASREVLVSLSAPAALEVTVRDAEGQLARDAEVWVSGIGFWPPRQVRTGADGVARLEGLARGAYELRARLGAQVSAAAPGVTLERGERARASLSLAPGRFVAIVVSAAEGDGTAPVSGADVTLVEDGLSPFPLASRTAADGTVRLGPVPASSAVINVRADGFMPESVPVPRHSEAPLRIALVRGGRLSGRIVDADGRAIEGARLEVVGDDLRGRPIARGYGTLAAPHGFFERSLPAPLPLVPMGELGVLATPLPVPGMPPLAPAPTTAWVSDLDGNYHIADVPPGRLRLLARHPDFMEALSDAVTLEPGGSAHVQLVLERGASLGGRVLDPLGRPVARARVELLSPRATQSSALTGSDGFFAFRAVPTRFDLLVARPDDRQRYVLRQSVVLAAGEAREIELKLPAERPALAVTARSDDGRPLTGARVSLLSLDPKVPLRQSVESDARGECSLLDAVGIPATLRVQAPGFRIFETELEPVPPRVAVTLTRGVSVSGRVTQAAGREGVRGAELGLLQDGERRSALSDERGNYEISGVALGPAELSLRHPDFSPATWDVSIAPGDREGRAAPLEPIELDEPGVASGTVLDARGAPVRGARVGVGLVPAFVPAGARLPGFVESDERGHFELRGVEPGRQMLSAYVAGVGRGSLDGVVITARERTTGLEIRLVPSHAESEPAAANVAVTLGERGAGAELEVVIVNVAAGSEAERAGVRQGDVLWSIDAQAVADMKDARAMLGGSDGSDVILELDRQGESAFVRVRREAVR
jgi:Carboxypeptidase regulatory-like domain/PDZ domain